MQQGESRNPGAGCHDHLLAEVGVELHACACGACWLLPAVGCLAKFSLFWSSATEAFFVCVFLSNSTAISGVLVS